MNNATLNVEEFLNTIALPAYKQYSKVQDYIVILENTIESLNRETSELKAALEREKAKTVPRTLKNMASNP